MVTVINRSLKAISVLAGITGLSLLIGISAFAQTPQTTPGADQPGTTTPENPQPGTGVPATPQPGTDVPAETQPGTEVPATPPTETETPADTQTETDTPANTTAPVDTSNQPLTQLLQVASNQGSFTTLAKLVQAAGVADVLQSQGGNFTIFAPTDAAFAELPAGTVEKLQRPENRALLRRVLAYHIVPRTLTSGQLQTGGLQTLGGGVAVRVTDERVILNNGSVVQPDIRAANGVVHAINQVLIPAELRQQLTSLR